MSSIYNPNFWRSYTWERLSSLGISEAENLVKKDVLWGNVHHFEKAKFDGIQINYFDLYGQRMCYRTGGKWKERTFYKRTRLKNPTQDVKYLSPKNSGCLPYLNGLYQYFTKDADTLPVLETIVVTEGEFKAFKACKDGIPTVGISGIHNGVQTVKDQDGRTINAYLLPELEEALRLLQTKKIILLHDNDARENDQNPERAFSFYGAILYFSQACRNSNLEFVYGHIKEDKPKGLDDLLQAYEGRENAVKDELLKGLSGEFFSFPEFESLKEYLKLTPGKVEAIEINAPGRYISDGSFKNPELDSVLNSNPLAILEAKAGTGKTEYIVHYAQRIQKRLLLCLPYTVLTKQARTRFKNLGLLAIDGSSDKEDILEAMASNAVAVTYDSLPKIAERFEPDQTLIVVDEFHNLVNQYGFRLGAINSVFLTLSRFKQCVLMSATPNLLFCEQGFTHVLVRSKHKNFANLHRIDYEKDKEQIIFDLVRDTPDGFLSVIRTTADNRTLDLIRETLINQGAARPEEVAVIYNRELETGNNTEYNEITELEQVGAKTRFLLCSPKITDGANIKNKNVYRVVVVNEYEPDNIIQFCARFREMETLEVYSLRRAGRNGYDFNEITEFKNCRNFAERLIKQNTENDEISQEYRQYIEPGNKYFISHRYITESNEFNFIQAAADIREKFKKSLSLDAFYQNIAERSGNIRIKPFDLPEPGKDLSEEISLLKEKSKTEREEAEQKTWVLIQKDVSFFFELLYHLTKNRELKTKISKNFGFDRVQSVKVKMFIEKEREFFQRQDKVILKAANKFLFCYPLFKSFLSVGEIIRFIQDKGSQFDRWKLAVKMYYAKFLNDEGFKLPYNLAVDVRRMEKDLELLYGKFGTRKELQKTINSPRHRRYKPEKVYGKDFSNLLYAYFPTATYNKGTGTYSGLDQVSFLDLLPGQIDREKYREYCLSQIQTFGNETELKYTENKQVTNDPQNDKSIKNDKFKVNTADSWNAPGAYILSDDYCPF